MDAERHLVEVDLGATVHLALVLRALALLELADRLALARGGGQGAAARVNLRVLAVEVERRLAAVALGALQVGLGGEQVGAGGAGAYAFGVGLVAVLALVLFARVLPGAAHPERAGWILAALALASCVVFWSGLPFVLGFAAAYCGARAGRVGPVVTGLLAVAAAVVGCFIG